MMLAFFELCSPATYCWATCSGRAFVLRSLSLRFFFEIDTELYALLRGKARASPEQISPSKSEHLIGAPVLSIQHDPAAGYFCMCDLQMAVFGREGS